MFVPGPGCSLNVPIKPTDVIFFFCWEVFLGFILVAAILQHLTKRWF